jgi:hypothetical protein
MLRFHAPFVSTTAAPVHTRHPAVREPLAYATMPSPDTDAVVSGHVDYDRHPLGVHEYEHYVAQSERDERFHVR